MFRYSDVVPGDGLRWSEFSDPTTDHNVMPLAFFESPASGAACDCEKIKTDDRVFGIYTNF